jgi:hypothetical protein
MQRALATPINKNTISAQARKHGLNPFTVFSRMKRGMSLQQALTT